MTFQEQLNLYIEELSCSGRELAKNSGISETILSRYRKGERLPGADSDYLKKLAAGIALTAEPVSYTHLRAHETGRNLVCRLLLEKKKK